MSDTVYPPDMAVVCHVGYMSGRAAGAGRSLLLRLSQAGRIRRPGDGRSTRIMGRPSP